MPNPLIRNWWTVSLRGLFAVLFGLCALLVPGLTLASLVLLFGAYALADGVMSIAAAFTHRQHWWAHVLSGSLGIVVAAVAFFWPAITALALLYLIALWALMIGAFQLIAATRLREEFAGEVLLIVSGIASLAFGVLAIVWPGAGALTVMWLIGSYALLFGVLQLVLGFRLHALWEPGARSATSSHGHAGA